MLSIFLVIFFFPIYREFDNCPRNNKCNSFYLLNPKSPTPEITINTCENCGNCSILLLVRLRVSGYRYLKFWQLLWDRWRRLLSIERENFDAVFLSTSPHSPEIVCQLSCLNPHGLVICLTCRNTTLLPLKSSRLYIENTTAFFSLLLFWSRKRCCIFLRGWEQRGY